MNNQNFTRWIMQTARTWQDISPVVRETGIEFVDHDHRIMTEYALGINNMVDRMSKGAFDLECVREQAELFKNLYEYTEMHFSREEAFIKKYGLAGIEIQEKAHAEILASLLSMLHDFESGRLAISLNLKLAIMEWVVVHINNTDYNTFQIEKWRDVFLKSACWEDVSVVVKKMDIDVIDREHREMTGLMTELNFFINDMPGTEQIPEKSAGIAGLLESLYQKAESHFNTEKRFAEKYRIPGFDNHDKQHKKFLDLLVSYKKDLPDGKLAITAELKHFTMNWWIDHINTVDHETFLGNPWARRAMENASSWEDVEEVIKKINIEIVDNDHRKMTEMAIDFGKLIAPQEEESLVAIDIDEVQKAFEGLHQFASAHFDREQDIIKEKNLPGLENQCREHKKFLKLIGSWKEQILDGRLVVTPNLKGKILDWWINHINGIDYRTFVG